MFTMSYDIRIGEWSVGMLEAVEIHSSVELLADTATITLPGAEYNKALDIEQAISVGNPVSIRLGYAEVGMTEEFTGYVQRIGTDDGNITIECEDDLYRFRVPLQNRQLVNITLANLLSKVIAEMGGGFDVQSTYDWRYEKFVIHDATAYDVLKKVRDESGADIYLRGNTLHIHPPAEKIGKEIYYDFAQNVQSCDLKYLSAQDRKVKVVVTALLPDGTVKKREYGTTGGDMIEVKSASSDEASMRSRGESEYRRRSFDGYEGSITTWLIPHAAAGDTAYLFDAEYEYKNGRYFIESVTTSFDSSGATRNVKLGFRLS
ncbi:MAG: hypothetical protein ACI3Y2_06820 [Candidatus Egerieousia sp.]